MLATGIGVAATGFTLLEAVLFSKLPFAGGERFVLLNVYEEPEATRATLEPERFRLFRDNAPAFQHLGAFRGSPTNLILRSGEVVPVGAAVITPDSFEVLPSSPVVGRTLANEDAAVSAPPVVMLRESLWRRHFSAEPSIVGQPVNVSGTLRTVVGVVPNEVEFPNSPEIWIPFTESASAAIADAEWSDVRVFGVLAQRGTERAATAQVAALSQQLEAGRPELRRLRITVLPLIEAVSQGLDILAGALVAVLVMVLLVISASVANLVLARTLSRSTELAVRTALGATRAQLVGQIFVEAMLLGVVAAVIGLVASQTALRWITATLTDMPYWIDFTASPRTIAFVVCAALLSAAVCGVLPALRVTRRSLSLAAASASRPVSSGFGRTGSLMIALQITLAIAVLHAALVVARGVSGYMEGGPALPTGSVLTARVSTIDAGAGLGTAVVEAVERMDGVRHAGLSSSLPRLSPALAMTSVRSNAGEPESVARAAPVVSATRGFFETLGASAQIGRLFQTSDFADHASPVAIVNEPFVVRFFGGANPVGRQLRVVHPDLPDGLPGWHEVVGVVPDLGLSAGDVELSGGFYLPMRDEQVFYLSLRTARDPANLAAPLRATMARVDPRIAVLEIVPLEDVGSEDRAVFGGIAMALSTLGGVTLLLSVIGVYAMLSFSVTQRTREIAIRSALGATRCQVLRSVLEGVWLPLMAGGVAGPALGSILVAARGIFAFRLPASSGLWGWPLLVGLMLAAGLTASWLPAHRALRITTSDALRSE